MLLQVQSAVGIVAIPALAYLLCERRGDLRPARAIRIVLAGIAVQIVIAGLLLTVPALSGLLSWPARGVDALQAATNEGMRVVFGYLAGDPPPYDVTHPERTFVLAFQALPLVLTVSVLSRLLYHWGVLQWLIRAFAVALKHSLSVTGPVGTAAAANIFVGMVEAPLLVRPYLQAMSRGGLFATMTVGMAGVAGTVLALYASLLKDLVPGAAGHLIVASIISVPAALVLSYLMVPERDEEASAKLPSDVVVEAQATSSMDAIAQGAREGVMLLVNVAAMLVVAIALVALANMLLGAVLSPLGVGLRLEQILGWPFAILAWLIGIPWSECAAAGSLLGVKTVLNEFVAYLNLSALPPEALAPRSRLIMTYALCGFANFGSLGIMIGGLVAMVPERRSEIISLGSRTLISGTLSTLMTAAVVGMLTPG